MGGILAVIMLLIMAMMAACNGTTTNDKGTQSDDTKTVSVSADN